ncbi:DEAD/DEAH box helicase family protein [Streptomyces mobaraensis]|uniref:DEAD/DEAH box helicase family protein n=1 Tax=Streptomyces mobaraensis TaxID=35621 RepID=UPI0033E3968C
MPSCASCRHPSTGTCPAEGLRTQVIAATGSGKTLIAAEAARNLGARRVLILVPTRVARGVRARRGSYPGSVASAGERTPPPGTRAERARGRTTAGRPVGAARALGGGAGFCRAAPKAVRRAGGSSATGSRGRSGGRERGLACGLSWFGGLSGAAGRGSPR